MADSIYNEETVELDALEMDAQARRIRVNQIEFILRVYIGMGLITAIGSLVYFGFSFLQIDLTSPQRMSLIVAGTGVMVSLMSAMLLAFRRQRLALRSEAYHVVGLDYDLIKEWAKFESIGRRVLYGKGIDFNPRSPRAIVAALESNALIPSELAREIRMALDVRNKVVHNIEPMSRPIVQASSRILEHSNQILNLIITDGEDGDTVETSGVSGKILGRRSVNLDD